MRLRRIFAALVVTTLAAPTALLTTATPATAGTTGTTATKIVPGTSGHGWIYRSSYATQPGALVYGDTLELAVKVVDSSGNQVFDGSLAVQRQLPGKSWTTIKSVSDAYLYDSTKAVGNAKYRVLYSGTSTYAPSGAGVSAKVQRKITFRDVGSRRVVLSGKVAPGYHGKVMIMKQKGKRWTRYKVVRANKRSHFQTPLPAPRKGRFYWRIQLPKGGGFVASQTGRFYTYSY